MLLPSAVEPLHIFEPRYRQLLDDCLATDRRFGIIYHAAEQEARDVVPGVVGCVAQIEATQPMDDGRSNIVVTGHERFVLRELLVTGRPYLVGGVDPLDDIPQSSESLRDTADRVVALFSKVGKAARQLQDDESPLPALPADPSMLSFAIAQYVDFAPAEKQRLLSAVSPAARLEQIEQLLAPIASVIEAQADTHARARTNGHGPVETR